MIYVMSDLHGEYEKYQTMLQKIGFSDTDTLYILGDVLDRGERPIDLLLDMMYRPNVYPILGNHEVLAMRVLQTLAVEITADNYQTQITPEVMRMLLEWQENGGDTTIRQFRALAKDDREAVLDYLEEFSPYEIVKVGKKVFILVHSGLENFAPEKELDDYTVLELTFCRPDYETPYFDDPNITVIAGHTPTLALTHKAEIYHAPAGLVIDCGATFSSGRLACLCLDTMEEYYV